jgi:inorganic pyrophosphatase
MNDNDGLNRALARCSHNRPRMNMAPNNVHRIKSLHAYDAEKHEWEVVIETPAGSHNKYKYDEARKVFILNSVLPEGMVFPYDFGFLPATRGEDGDPLDVLLLMDDPVFCGCVVPSRFVGVIEAEQTERDETCQRNDRIVAVPLKCRTYSDCESLKQLNPNRLHEIEMFFVAYNQARGKKFKVLDVYGPKKAERLAQAGAKLYAKQQKKRRV